MTGEGRRPIRRALISVYDKTGLAELAAGKPVTCQVRHSDGTSEAFQLNHSFSTSQLEWFRKGSALNLFH